MTIFKIWLQNFLLCDFLYLKCMSLINKMSFEIVQTLYLFLKQITSLHKEDKIANNYCILLSKITESKILAIETQVKTVEQFLIANNECLLKTPLTLNSYKLFWFPLLKDVKNTTFSIDLLPAFSKATDMENKILHCHVLKLASLFYPSNDDYSDLLKELKLKLPVNEDDIEFQIVKNLFKRIRECDVSDLTVDSEPEHVINTFQKNGLSEFVADLRKPNLRWKILFQHLVDQVEILSKETGKPEPMLEALIEDIKSSNYEVYKIAPKLIKFIMQFNLTNIVTPFQSMTLSPCENLLSIEKSKCDGDCLGCDEKDGCKKASDVKRD